MADHIGGTLKVNVNMSELDEAIQKAERLLAMLDEIDARTDRGNMTAPLAGNIQVRTAEPIYPYPPRLNPQATGWVCDQCDRHWGMGQTPDCHECAAALDARG